MIDLLPDEEAMLNRSERCNACGHLEALHNDHCCPMCMVDDCECEWGELIGNDE